MGAPGRALKETFEKVVDAARHMDGLGASVTKPKHTVNTHGSRTEGMDTPGDMPGQPRTEDGRYTFDPNKNTDSRYERVPPRPSDHARAWKESVDPDTGFVHDPVTGDIMNPNEPYHMGHPPGMEFRHPQRSARERDISREQFASEERAIPFRPELPSTSSSGTHEIDDYDEYIGPGSEYWVWRGPN